MNFASVLKHRTFKIVLLGGALTSLAGIYLAHRGTAGDLAARSTSPASTSPDGVDQSVLTTARRLAAQANDADERQAAAEAVQVADRAVDQEFAIALQEGADTTPLTGDALTTSQKITALEMTVEEEKQHVAALTAARLKTASQNDVAGLGEQAQLQLELDTETLNELHRKLVLLGGDKQARIQQALDEHSALHEELIAHSTSENDSGLSQRPVTLPGKIRAVLEMRGREKQLRLAAREATTAAARITQQNEDDARIQDQQQLEIIYSSWAGLVRTKRMTAEHRILQALAVLAAICVAVPFGLFLIQRELTGKDNGRPKAGHYPVVAGVVVEVLALAMALIVIFGTPIKIPGALGL